MNQEQTYRCLALGIGVIATCVWGVASGAEPSGGGKPVVVVRSSRAGGAVAVGGVVVPEKEITFTAQMPGQIVRIAGKEGTPFKAGTVLVAPDKECERNKLTNWRRMIVRIQGATTGA